MSCRGALWSAALDSYGVCIGDGKAAKELSTRAHAEQKLR